MEVLHRCCCGLDVQKQAVVACLLRMGIDGRRGKELRHLAAAYPSGPLVLAMDNVCMHDAKVVRAWLAANPRVSVRWRPKYAAHDANPVERIWGLMKGAVAANRLAGSLAELTGAARRFLAALAPHPVPLTFLEAPQEAA